MSADSNSGRRIFALISGREGGVRGNSVLVGRVENVLAVDVRIPGCPPTPAALMQGILAAVKRRK